MKISIDNKEYTVDFDKAIELGVLKEDKKFNLMPERCKDGEYYWFVYMDGTLDYDVESSDSMNNRLYECGNYFKSAKVAQYVLDNNLNPFDKIHNYIAHKNVEIGWKPDWDDHNQDKHALYFDHMCETWVTESTYSLEVCKIYSTKEVIEELRDKLNSKKRGK